MHIQQEVARGSDELMQIKVPAQCGHIARAPQTILLSLEKRGMRQETEFLSDPVIPRLDLYPKESKTEIQAGTCMPMFTLTLFTIAER